MVGRRLAEMRVSCLPVEPLRRRRLTRRRRRRRRRRRLLPPSPEHTLLLPLRDCPSRGMHMCQTDWVALSKHINKQTSNQMNKQAE